MVILSKKKLMSIINEYVLQALGNVLVELDKDKYYILVLPTSISMEESREHLGKFTDKSNLAVIHADDIKLVELS
jgi:hypothetical protein